jgi:hypothetical protein
MATYSNHNINGFATFFYGGCIWCSNFTPTPWKLFSICHIAFQQGSYFQITLRLASLNDSKMLSSGVNMAIVQDVVQGNIKLV